MLNIVALSYNDLAPAMPVSGSVPANGGTIGREPGNSLTLPDPTRGVSRCHVEFFVRGYREIGVRNVSEENYAQVDDDLLEPGDSTMLHDGSRLVLGCYVLEVTYGGEHLGESGPEGKPASALDGVVPPEAEKRHEEDARRSSESSASDLRVVGVGNGAIDETLDLDMLIESAVSRRPRNQVMDSSGIGLSEFQSRSDGLISGAYEGRVSLRGASPSLAEHRATILGDASLDPLQLFEGGGGSDVPGIDISFFGTGDGSADGGSHDINRCAELSVPFRVPGVGRDSAGEGLERPRAGSSANSPSEMLIPDDDYLEPFARNAEPAVESPLTGDGDSSDSACGTSCAEDVKEFAPVSSASPAVEEVQGGRQARSEPKSVSRAAGAGGEEDELFRAFLEGTGLPEIPSRTSLDPEFMRRLGRLLSISSSGLVKLLAGRAMVKREVRANVTVIAPARNNPLKFSPDGEVALMYLLGNAYPGFMDADSAMEEIFADLHAHQLGMIAGMRAALGHVLSRFDPSNIEQNSQTGGVIEGLLTVGRKAKLWDSYGRYFVATKEEADDRFQEFFGAVFLDAYEHGAAVGQQAKEEAD